MLLSGINIKYAYIYEKEKISHGARSGECGERTVLPFRPVLLAGGTTWTRSRRISKLGFSSLVGKILACPLPMTVRASYERGRVVSGDGY
ncbi:hypothetical protein AVEN_241069-1 [Araneus ventricosus]|uniref:Uncharacterized protein n=1 Tax=Araneus ventricosus TaxID=182803 RepID=A0A4Y2Q5Q4_ARAVE|nr:hypothetical protein AVEN_241069-1 [Araneus ventricosus]